MRAVACGSPRSPARAKFLALHRQCRRNVRCRRGPRPPATRDALSGWLRSSWSRVLAPIFYYENSRNVDVEVFLSSSPSNTCRRQNSTEVGDAFNNTPGATIDGEFEFRNANTAGPCTPTSIPTNTTGFSLPDATWNPTSVPASPAPFASNDPEDGIGEVSFALAIPGSGWSGNVDRILN